MMAGRQSTRHRGGRPLVALSGVLVLWVGLRAAVFELPREWRLPLPQIGRLISSPLALPIGSGGATAATPRSELGWSLAPHPMRPLAPALPEPVLQPALASPPSDVQPRAARPTLAAGHNLLWMAAMQAMPVPPELAAAMLGGPRRATALTPRGRAARWSGDVWVLLRQGAGLGAGVGEPVYGGSQAGAVLRYRLAPSSRHQPAAYVRVVQALGGTPDTDLAVGLSARPFAGIPVTGHVEARASRRSGETIVRPAAFVTAGFDEARLPLGARARAYAQAGYVGGQEATAFADGALVVDRPVVRRKDSAVSAGGGLWGGAQRGAARFDIGPTASLRFRLGDSAARVAVDYRLRVAGEAAPAAGAALTLSAGF